MIVVLTGGTGGAKLVQGLQHEVAPENLTVIVNTGDDIEWWGLHVSPDIDSILYALAGSAQPGPRMGRRERQLPLPRAHGAFGPARRGSASAISTWRRISRAPPAALGQIVECRDR